MTKNPNRLDLRVPPLAVTAGLAGVMWLASVMVPAAALEIPGSTAVVGAMTLLGSAFVVAAGVSFRRARTTVDPRKPHATSTLVSGGVYRLSRNPMYVGFLLWLGAWALCLEHLLVWLALPAFVVWMNRFQIVPEERALRERFGNDYDQYSREVRRWL